MDDKNIEEYNPNKKLKVLIVFNDIIANMHLLWIFIKQRTAK